jgi:hypothetical protein
VKPRKVVEDGAMVMASVEKKLNIWSSSNL